MASGMGEEYVGQEQDSSGKDPKISYRYWVGRRGDGSEPAAPSVAPRKLSKEEVRCMTRVDSEGSMWNQGGTWEEKCMNDWARARLDSLLKLSKELSVDGCVYSLGTELTSCSGDTTVVIVRNKKRHGYLLDIDLKVRGNCIDGNGADVEGTIHIHDATYGEVDDLEVDVKVDASKSKADASLVLKWESLFKSTLIPLIQEKMSLFEKELASR